MSGDPQRDGKPWRAVVAVFVEIPDAGDQRGADVAAEMAVHQALAGTLPRLPVDTQVVSLRGRDTVQIVNVMELGIAAGNGYLWTRATAKAFYERGQS